MTEDSTLKNLVNVYYGSQKFRIAVTNRITSSTSDPEGNATKIREYDAAKAFSAYKKRVPRKFKDMPQTREAFDAVLQRVCDDVDAVYNAPLFNDPFAIASQRVIRQYAVNEKNIAMIIENQLENYPISKWLTAHVGIGPMLAAGLIAYTDPILEHLTYAQSLWKYSGYAVDNICQTCGKRHIPQGSRARWIARTATRLQEQNNKLKDTTKKRQFSAFVKDAEAMLCHCESPDLKAIGQRRIRGQLADFNPEMKKICYLVGDQFIKQRNSPYRAIYDQARLEYTNRPDLMKEMNDRKGGISKGTAHINAMARRKAIKLFLAHFWHEFSRLEGFETPNPYAEAVLGHHDIIPPYISLEDVGLSPARLVRPRRQEIVNIQTDD